MKSDTHFLANLWRYLLKRLFAWKIDIFFDNKKVEHEFFFIEMLDICEPVHVINENYFNQMLVQDKRERERGKEKQKEVWKKHKVT